MHDLTRKRGRNISGNDSLALKKKGEDEYRTEDNDGILLDKVHETFSF